MDFVDSNIWLYAVIVHGEAFKSEAALKLVTSSRSVVSTQTVNEVCRNLRQKGGFDDERLRTVIVGFYRNCNVVRVDKGALLEGCRLREKYQFSFWDSLVVAAALAAGCSKLYSEDMHDGLVVDGGLTIINPFRQP